MEKINIAEILKDCPNGMELDCALYENLEFDHIEYNSHFSIICRAKTELGSYNVHTFTEHGCYSTVNYAKCVIYPKGKTTWEGFVPPCKFKVGDKIKHKTYISQGDVVTEIKDNYYILNAESALPFVFQNEYELVPTKFDITTFKAFESRVLVRDYDNQIWIPTFWGKYLEDDSNCRYLTTNGCYKYCIPFEGNEHLLGTTNDCDEFYKTW